MNYFDSRVSLRTGKVDEWWSSATYFHCQACYTLNTRIIPIDYASRDFFVLSFHLIGRSYFYLGTQALACQCANYRIQRLATLSKAK